LTRKTYGTQKERHVYSQPKIEMGQLELSGKILREQLFTLGGW
jgi:hypothetical protein